MQKLTADEVRHIAHLARIRLTEEEVKLFQDQLTTVIEYNINLLSEVDVTGVQPTAQTSGIFNAWRDDLPAVSLAKEVALAQAPARLDGQFMVKKVLGES